MNGGPVGKQRLHWVEFCPSPVFFFFSPADSAVFLDADLAREAVCNNAVQARRVVGWSQWLKAGA